MAHRDFNEIYLGLHQTIYRLAAGIVGSGDEAEDVVQDLYERLWVRRASIVSQPRPEGYILASARNLCLDRLRSRRPQGQFPAQEMAATGGRPDEGEMEEIVAGLMAALPGKQGMVMTLRDVECMEVEEISRVTGMSGSAVRMSLSRARNTVREKLVKILEYGI
jgi:RNA polymerase sigma-70 factor (ECF subfamily)